MCSETTIPAVKCVRVEYDLTYYGGNYSGVGEFVYLPWETVDRCPGGDEDERLKAAFYILTGHDRIHIVHYTWDEPVDQFGNEWHD